MRRVLMLGTPNHGTDLAGLASSVVPDFCPSACRGTRSRQRSHPATERRRRDAVRPELGVDLVRRRSRRVSPDSASLDGALDIALQSVCGNDVDVSHSDLPTDSAVVSLVVALLGPGPPVMPTQADC